MNNFDKNREFFRSFKALKYTDAPLTPSHPSEIVMISLNVTGTRLVNSRTDKSLRIWRCFPDRLADPVIIEAPHAKAVESVTWNPKTEYTFATVGRDEWVKIWRSNSGKLEKQFKVGAVALERVSYSPDGEVLAAVDRSSCVHFFSVQDYSPMGQLQLSQPIYDLEWFNHRHQFFVVALQDGTIPVYELAAEPILRKTLTGHRSAITTVKMDPRGQHLVAGSNEGVVSVWTTGDLMNTHVIGDVDQAVSCLDFSRDGAYIAVGYDSGANARIYDVASREMIFEAPASVSGKTVLASICWFPNKTSFVYGSENSRVMVYMRADRKGV